MKLFKNALAMLRQNGFRELARSVPRYLCWHPLLDEARWHFFCFFSRTRTIKKGVAGKYMFIQPCLDGIHKELFLYGQHEKEATNIFKSLIPEGAVVLEIGANIGYYVLIEAQKASRIYALEPSPVNFRFLEKNIALNGLKDLVEIHQVALSDTPGQAKFSISAISNHHHLLNQVEHPAEVMTVQASTPDEFLNGRDVDVIRMDVQGAEWLIFNGMKQILESKKHLLIFFEIHSREIKLYGGGAGRMLSGLFDQGFQIAGIVFSGYREGNGPFLQWFTAPNCPHQYVFDPAGSGFDLKDTDKLLQFLENKNPYCLFLKR